MSEATMTPSAKNEISGGLQMSAQLLTKDIKAMDDQMLAANQGGKARCGFDLLFEIATVNRMFANVIRGETNDTPRPEGWVVAPSDYRSKDAARKNVEESVNEVLAAIESVPEDQLGKEIDSPLGPMPIHRLVAMVGSHMMYHSGQLNYIQTIHGDDTFHWMEA